MLMPMLFQIMGVTRLGGPVDRMTPIADESRGEFAPPEPGRECGEEHPWHGV